VTSWTLTCSWLPVGDLIKAHRQATDPRHKALQTVGLIVLIVGGVGLVIALSWMALAADRRSGPRSPVATWAPETARRATDGFG
jgi:hypothetical protein